MQEEVLFSSSPALYFALLPRQSSLITCLALITTKRIIILLNFFKVSHFSSTTGSEREPQRAPVIPNVINGNLAPPPMIWIQFFELETVNYPVSFLHRKWKMDRTHFCVAVAWHDHKCSLWLDFYIKWIQIPHQLIAWKYLYSMSQHFVFSSWWINVLIGLLN